MRPLFALVLLFVCLLSMMAFSQATPADSSIPLPPSQTVCPTFVNSSPLHVQGCTIYVQAGLPYSGKLVEYNLCGPIAIYNVGVQFTFKNRSDPNDSPHEIRIGDVKWKGPADVPDGYISGTYKGWDVPGTYDLLPSVSATCNWNGRLSNVSRVASPGTVQVFKPEPPTTMMFDNSLSYRVGQTYAPFSTVGLRSEAPKSGTLIRLKTNNPGVVDISTQYGQTSKDIPYTYAWIPPDVAPPLTSFDVVISNTAQVGLKVVISADCVGSIGTQDACNLLTRKPKMISFTVEAPAQP